MTHPSELVLEGHLLEPSPEVTTHAAGCPLCSARLARMAEEGETFHRDVYPRAVSTVRAAATSGERPARRWFLVGFPALAAAAAALVLVLLPGGPDPDYAGLKGAELGLSVYVGSAGDASAVIDGARVAPDAALRFSLRTARPCQLWLASVDGNGQVSQLYPPGGRAPAPLDRSGPLPGGAILDGQVGPERLYAICSPGGLSWDVVAARIRVAAVGGAVAVRNGGTLTGLPQDAAQATLLLEKKR